MAYRAINFITAVSTLVDCASSGLMARSAVVEGTSSAEMLDDLVFYLELGVLVGKSRREGIKVVDPLSPSLVVVRHCIRAQSYG